MADIWFKPKTHGYGASPANWKGWAATAGYVVAMIALSLGVFGLERRPAVSGVEWAVWLGGVIVATVTFVIISRSKTDGPWKWRWGDKVRDGR